MNKNIKIGIIGLLAICLVIPALYLMNLATGAVCTTQTCAGVMNITLGNTAPTIPFVLNGTELVTLTGATTKTVYVQFNVTDINGVTDLNVSTASVNLSKTGQTNRTSSSCVTASNSSTGTLFNCTIAMQFYDSAGVWTITAYVADKGGQGIRNATTTFTVNSLDYVSQDITAIAWGSVSAGTNDNQATAPMILTNGGNQNYSNVSIIAYNATGVALADKIMALNFSVDSLTGQTTGQTYMKDGSYQTVSELIDLNAHGAAVTESIFFYVDLISALRADTYNSDASWSVKATAT